MPLRIRRGTNSERLTITPLEGELVYTTDTKLLYIGDGTSAGGNPAVGGFSGTLTSNLNLSGFNITGTGNINITGSINSTTLTSSSSATIGGALNVSGNAFVQGSIDAAGFIGSVFRDNSTLIIDAITGDINAERIFAVNNIIRFFPTASGVRNDVHIHSTDERSNLKLTRDSATDLTGSTVNYGGILFERNDINGPFTPSFILGGENYIVFAATVDGNFSNLRNFLTWRDQKLGIGTNAPTDTLDVRGNGIFTGTVQAAALKGSVFGDDSTVLVDAINGSVSGSNISATGFVQFGSLDAAARAALTPVNGMVIYNTTANRFQGYQNGAWINLDDGTPA